MSVSSMESVAEFTVAEGTVPTIIDVPDDLTTATVETLRQSVLDHCCVENDRVKIFYLTATFDNDDVAALAAKGKVVEPKDVFGKISSKMMWCTVNVEQSENEHLHFHAVAEMKSRTRINTVLNSMRKIGTTVNQQSEATFRHSFVKMDRPRGPWKQDRKWMSNITNVLWYCQKDKTKINHFETGLIDGKSPTEWHAHVRKTLLKGTKAPKKTVDKAAGGGSVDDAIEVLNEYLSEMRHFDGPSAIRKLMFKDGHGSLLLKHGNKIDEMVNSYKALAFPKEPRVNQGWFAWFGAPECGKTYGVNKWSRFMASDALGEDWDADGIPLRSIVHRFNLKETKTSYVNEPILQCEEFFGDVLKLNDFKEINPIGTDDHTFSMPVKYKVEQATFNHVAMAITSNHWPIDWYRGVFGGNNGDTEWQAFMRRCGGLYFYPKYRITDESDPRSVELDANGKPVINKVELDGPTLIREAQWVDLTTSLRTQSFMDAMEVKIQWIDQLGTMSLHDKIEMKMTEKERRLFRYDHTEGGKYNGTTARG